MIVEITICIQFSHYIFFFFALILCELLCEPHFQFYFFVFCDLFCNPKFFLFLHLTLTKMFFLQPKKCKLCKFVSWHDVSLYTNYMHFAVVMLLWQKSKANKMPCKASFLLLAIDITALLNCSQLFCTVLSHVVELN